jgi:TorA maturation chaperone TorD
MARDGGLEEAIRKAGGVGALARALGIAQPSVSSWQQIPANRVLAVEAATGVARTLLRPDLYPATDAGTVATLDEIDRARAQEYELLALLLGRAPTEGVLAKLGRLRGDSSTLGMAHLALAEAATNASATSVNSEYFALFIGLGRGVLLPYGSYYLTGFLHERPLARVREDMAVLGLERAEREPEPEDHIAILCETMAAIIQRDSGADGADRRFFDRHLKPWAGRFFADLETAREAVFYRPVGMLGRLFMEVEDQAFRLETRERPSNRGENGQSEARIR